MSPGSPAVLGGMLHPQLSLTADIAMHVRRLSAAMLLTAFTCFNLQSQVSRVQWLPQFEGPHLKPSMWRKSSQWSMILRSHAEVPPPARALPDPLCTLLI